MGLLWMLRSCNTMAVMCACSSDSVPTSTVSSFRALSSASKTLERSHSGPKLLAMTAACMPPAMAAAVRRRSALPSSSRVCSAVL